MQPLLNNWITGVGNCDATPGLHTGASNAATVEAGAFVEAVIDVTGISVEVEDTWGTCVSVEVTDAWASTGRGGGLNNLFLNRNPAARITIRRTTPPIIKPSLPPREADESAPDRE